MTVQLPIAKQSLVIRMSRDRFVKLISISFHWLLIALLCVAASQYRGGRFAELGGGFIYFCLAGYFSILATAPRWQKLFVDAGYMSFLVALLNYFASPKGAQLLVAYQVVLAVVVGAISLGFDAYAIWQIERDFEREVKDCFR